MERVVKELERAIWMMRLETSGVQRDRKSRRESQGRLHRLQQAAGRGNRQRYAALAVRFDLAGHGGLRDMVQRWSAEEEQRERDAETELGQSSEPVKAPREELPLDATLWETYLDSIAIDRPMATLGALAVWERLRRAAHDLNDEGVRAEELATALRIDQLDEDELNELADGVPDGALMGLRLIRWALGLEEGAAGVKAWRINRLPAGKI